MISLYATALQAATEAAGGQHYPAGALYMVATPIGNLADITLRALHLLQRVDLLACEDTRHTQSLLRAYGIDRSGSALLPLHQHNETEAAQRVIERLRQGERVAYASDAGTPAISDPGARLVSAVRAAGLPVIPLPGASSITTLLSAAGCIDDTVPGFVFEGFLPARAGERASALQALAGEPRAVVLLEAPHRIQALATALATLGGRLLTVGRELTKQFEEIHTLRADEFARWLQADAHRSRGEFALVLHPSPATGQDGQEQRVLALLMAELPLKTAVRLTAEITGASRNALYESALALRHQS